MKTIPKVLFSVLITAALLFGGFFVWVITALTGGGRFYAGLIVAAFATLWLYLLANIWNLLKKKVRGIIAAAAALTVVVSAAGFEISRAYHNSIPKMDERGVNLALYDPFRADTLVASLDEPSALQIAENLPRLDGATALYPVYAGFVKAVYPADFQNESVSGGDPEVTRGAGMPEKAEIDTILTCSGTEGAYYRLIAGDADVIFAAEPSEGQLQMAKDAGVTLELTPVGREAFVFFVHSDNPVDGLSSGDMQAIYSGEGTSWRDFGGMNAPIRAFQRPEDSGSQTALIRFMGDVPVMAPLREDVVDGMGGIIRRVSAYRNYKNAIGYSFLFFTGEMVKDEHIKLLSIDGIAPTRENVANGSYPYAAEFYAVTAGTENPNAKAFIQWILSRQGQSLVEKTGYTPIS